MLKRLLFGSAVFATIIGLAAVGQTVLNPQNSALVCAYNSVAPTLSTGTFGYVQCNATGSIVASAPPVSGATTFTTPGANSFVVPANVTAVLVDAAAGGGGGGGGGATAANAGGGAGGSGMVALGYPLTVVPGATLTITIPSVSGGGAHNATGSPGGSVTITGAVETFPTLLGGAAGVGTTGTTGGAGGGGGGPANSGAGAAGAAAANGGAAALRIGTFIATGFGGGGGGSAASGAGGALTQGAFAPGTQGTGNAAGAGGAPTVYGNGGAGGNNTPTSGAAPTTGYGGGGGGGGPSNTDGTGSGGAGGAAFVRLRY